MSEIVTELKQQQKEYRPSAETVELVQTTQTILVVGPTGSGKNTAINVLLEDPDYHYFVSDTTRVPRDGEVAGVTYNYISPEQAKEKVETGDYIEYNVFGGNVYGTAASELKKAKLAGKTAITDIDVNGVDKFMELADNQGDILTFFILPYQWQAWHDRVMARGDLTREQLIDRARTAIQEFGVAIETPYYVFVVNDSVENMVSYMKEVIATKKVDEAKQAAGRELAQKLMDETIKVLQDNDIPLE